MLLPQATLLYDGTDMKIMPGLDRLWYEIGRAHV